jgi:hypothetical protein
MRGRVRGGPGEASDRHSVSLTRYRLGGGLVAFQKIFPPESGQFIEYSPTIGSPFLSFSMVD